MSQHRAIRQARTTAKLNRNTGIRHHAAEAASIMRHVDGSSHLCGDEWLRGGARDGAEVFLTDLPGFGQVAQLQLGSNGWALFNWTIAPQDAGTSWWVVMEASDVQNVSMAVIAFDSSAELEKTGQLLVTPGLYVTDSDAQPESASRTPFQGGMESLQFGRGSSSRPIVLVAVDAPTQQEIRITLIPNQSTSSGGEIPREVHEALSEVEVENATRIDGAIGGAGVGLQRFKEAWTHSNGTIQMHREWWPKGVSQQPAAASVPEPTTYAATNIRMAYGSNSGFVSFSVSVAPDPGVATSVVGRGTVLGHPLETSRGHVGGRSCLAIECNTPFQAYAATVHDAGQGTTHYALDIGLKGAVTDRIHIQSQLILIGADIEAFVGKEYPAVATNAYAEFVSP